MKRLALFFITCFYFLSAHAAYLKDVPMTLTQPDGTILHYFASGDEYFNYLHDTNGYTIMQHPVTGYYVYADKQDGKLVATDYIVGKHDPANKHLKPYNLISPEEWQKRRKSWEVPDILPKNRDFIPNHGTLNNIAIFIRFADDNNFTNTYSSIDNMFNDETEGAVSMTNYFRSVSYGAIEIPTHFYPGHNRETIISYQDIYPKNYFQPYNASTNPNGYNSDVERRLREFGLLQRAVEYVNTNYPIPANLDIDYNNDGLVDNVCFIVKGDVGAWSSLLWPHHWRLYDRNVTINGKRVYKYTLHLADAANYFNTSTLCHEMNHTLGAPDLYHYDDLTLEPVANWDLMAINSTPPQHCGAYMKMKYGHWLDEIPEITQAGTYTLNPISSPTPENVAYKIATEDPNQFYVLEYRNTSTPFESGLPGSGLLIYRIDTRFEGDANYNPSEGIYDEVYIFRPNGSYSSDGNSSIAFFCSTSRRSQFSPLTDPYPFYSEGTLDNNFRIYNITNAGNTISFTYGTMSTCVAPTNITATVSGRNVTLAWAVASNAQSYNIYRNGRFIGNTSETTFNDDNVSFGLYSYYIKSVDTQGKLSAGSESATTTIEPIASDLTATVSDGETTLSWSAPEWCVPETELAKLNYGEGDLYRPWSADYYAHRHLAADLAQYAGKAVYKVSTFIKYSGTYSAYIFTKSTQNGQPDPNSLAFSETEVSITSTNNWYEFNLNEPVILSGTDDLWVVIKQENTGQTYAVPSFDLAEHNINAFYIGNSPTNLYDCNPNYNSAWFINIFLTDGTYTYDLYQDGVSVATNLSDTTYSNVSLNNNAMNWFTVITNYSGGDSEASNKAGIIKGAITVSSINLGATDKLTITAGSKLTVTGTLSNSVASNLIIEDGAQLVNNSIGVKATMKKNITPYTANHNGWHLIASPITESITQNSGNGLFSNTYDLYSYNQSEELQWRNIKAQSFALSNKGGYLYANSGNPTISYSGTLVGNTSATPLSYNANVTGKGFNLIGNPYPCNANVNRSFYVLNADGSDFILGSNPVPPCAAILVQAQGANQRVTFSKASSKSSPSLTLSVMQAEDNTVLDKARINFGSDESLEKYTMREDNAKLFIPQNGQDLAVASANGTNEMPISFKAAQDGTYTLIVEVENAGIGYLHLIDNLTGDDIDLLTTPSYTFEAKASDLAERFRITIE